MDADGTPNSREALVARATRPRRRRRRCNTDWKEEIASQRKKRTGEQEHPAIDDSGFCIDLKEDTADNLPKVPPSSKNRSLLLKTESITMLLMQREIGMYGNAIVRWQEKALKGGKNPHKWKPFAYRKFGFRQLQTPACDAIIGIDRTGSYSIALGGRRNELETNEADIENIVLDPNVPLLSPSLALRFYGKCHGEYARIFGC